MGLWPTEGHEDADRERVFPAVVRASLARGVPHGALRATKGK
jgi:hypothetical protein